MDQSRDVSGMIPNLLILFLFAVGVMSTRPPLDTARPQSDRYIATERGPAMARLWEDPFGIPESSFARRERTTRGGPPTKPLDRVIERAKNDKTRSWAQRHGSEAPPPLRVLVLPVLLDGDPYAEAVETRLRTRYAVVSALGRAQYLPTDPEHVRFLQVDWDAIFDMETARARTGENKVRSVLLRVFDDLARIVSQAQPRERLQIPYEEFEVRMLVADGVIMARPPHDPDHANENFWPQASPDRNHPRVTITDPYDRVIVLWLNENDLTHIGRRLARARNASGAFTPHAIDRLLGQCIDPEKLRPGVVCDLTVIGPTGSDKLVDFIGTPFAAEESSGACGTKYPVHTPTFHKAEVLCPRATAADAVLKISSTYQVDFGSYCLSNQLCDSCGLGWVVSRTVATDDSLVDKLMQELELRQAAPSRGRDGNHMVIVSEWETLYARGIGRAISA